MKTPILFALALLLSALGSGCATVEKSTITASGMPEIVIAADVHAIKAAVIGDMVTSGYVIEGDSDFALTMSRPITGEEATWAGLAIGGNRNSMRRVTRYTFAPGASGVRVVVSSAWSVQSYGGTSRTHELASINGNIFNTFQGQLVALKAKIESEAAAPTKRPPVTRRK